MPSNRDFTLDILIGSVAVPEYEKEGQHFVECSLNTPLTYKEKATEMVQGVAESQEYPVTPYHIKVTAHTRSNDPHYFRVLVDGCKVKGLSLDAGQCKVIKGFRDGPCVRELLFSMPRFARDETDRLNPSRKESIGSIVVECWVASLKTRKLGLRFKELDFEQANKKDSSAVTEGKYIMATSRAGKKVATRSLIRSVDSWKLESQLSSISVRYHMSHTLVDMGFTLRPMDFSSCDVTPSWMKSEVKQENAARRFPRRKRRRVQPPQDPEVAVAALLALRGQSIIRDGRRSGSHSGQGDQNQPRDGADETDRHKGGDNVEDPVEDRRDDNDSDNYDDIDIEEHRPNISDAEDGELEIVHVLKGSDTKKPKHEPALIDLTCESDPEDGPTRSKDKIHFKVTPEVKTETPPSGSSGGGQPPVVDSGISSGISLTQESDRLPDSGVGMELDVSNPGLCVAMETVVESCEMDSNVDMVIEQELSINQSPAKPINQTSTTPINQSNPANSTEPTECTENRSQTCQSPAAAGSEGPTVDSTSTHDVTDK